MGRTVIKQKNALPENRRMDSLSCVAEGLATRIPSFKGKISEVVLALHEILDGADQASIDTRTKVQMHLVQVSNELLTGLPLKDEMISTEQAAQMMNCSRPYVAMLVDRKRLPGAVKTAGGHRKIPRVAVLAWIESNSPTKVSDADYKAAAREAGMYDIPDETYIRILASRKSKAASD